ncbi:MAG TPA: MlaD family protein [Solirubrobacteraceae bacterium]|nr:MlaD family protein [Solirubrobacteraceae bacterium]
MRRRSRVSKFAAGVIGAVVILLICYLVFGGSLPFSGSPYVLKAVFTSETQLHIPSEVRTAGVKIGQVVSVQKIGGPGSQDGVVTMDIDQNGLPIHADATVNIQPRIFLEGNFYVDLSPGSPSAPVLSSGSTLPAPQASGPVQLDRVLAALKSDSRANLQTLLQGIGSSLNAPPAAGEDASQNQDPSVRGLSGAQGLNLSLKYSVDAFRASAMVNQALLGIQPNDLANVVKGNKEVFQALADSGQQLPSFITSFNATMAALASRQQQLSQTIAALPPWLQATDNALGPIEASYVPTQKLAAALIPGIKQLDPTIGVALPWLQESTALMSHQDLGGLLQYLTPAVQNTASSLSATKTLLTGSDRLAQCFSHNIVPAGNQVILDPPGDSTGIQVYREFLQSAVGLAGASGNFDGNGRYTRASAGGGSDRVQTSVVGSAGPLFGNAVLAPLGARPAWPGHAPPLNRNVACDKNPVPNLNRVSTGGTP